MTEVEVERDTKFDDIDVESILARCERRGPVSFSRKRNLYQAPEFIKRLPATETVEEGSTVSFGCKIVGFPIPSVTWYKDDDVISTEARAKVENEENGVHSVHIADVSKCDGGTYKVCASNVEGSSSSSLYITVKAKSKLRGKKKNKRKGKTVATPPLFPAIIELVAEEIRETQEVELQPESPLTPIYCTISRKSPVIWPVFLGDWAYSNEELLHRCEIEDMEIGSEDVFENDVDVPPKQTLTFVSSAYAQYGNSPNNNDSSSAGTISDYLYTNAHNTEETATDKNTSESTLLKRPNNLALNNTFTDTHTNGHIPCRSSKQTNNSDKFLNLDDNDSSSSVRTDKLNNNHTRTPIENGANNTGGKSQEHAEYSSEPEVISVNRSYAKGNATFSKAKRSPSPFSKSRKPMTNNEIQNGVSNGSHFRNSATNDIDTTALQNMNNEMILNRMMQQQGLGYSHLWDKFVRFTQSANCDDNILLILLLLCGSTFLALYYDVSPLNFVLDILIAMVILFVLNFVLNS